MTHTLPPTALLIVGSGIAGMSCALEAQAAGLGPIVLITKRTLEDSNTWQAQGGIASALPHADRPAQHALDTLYAGAGHCDAQAVRCLCRDGSAAVAWLIDQGVAFDRHGNDWAFGVEAAHTRPRILHAQGDQTGRAIAQTLIARLRASSVRVMSHSMLVDLLVENGRVSGVTLLRDGHRFQLRAEHVMIATGGAGQVYAHTTNPATATGDGVACAFRAGAAIRDAEFVQFHPTRLATDHSCFLISEAVRGEGAVLRDAQGKRFMPARHPLGELAPRDIVAREIARVMAAQDGQPVWLDATALGEATTARFPGISATLSAHGLSLAHDRIPVMPAAHYWMGGIATDTWGRTTLPGLFAIGEAACTGVHGANRLASNSLLEAVVFARRSVHFLRTHTSDSVPFVLQTVPISRASPRETAPVSRQALQQLMWRAAGLERQGDTLRTALSQLQDWQQCAAAINNDIHALETRNLLTIGQLICQAALLRCESRGSHYRRDAPQPLAQRPRLPALRMTADPTASGNFFSELNDVAVST